MSDFTTQIVRRILREHRDRVTARRIQGPNLKVSVCGAGNLKQMFTYLFFRAVLFFRSREKEVLDIELPK